MDEKNNGLTIILVVVIVALLGFGAFYLLTQNNTPAPVNKNPAPITGEIPEPVSEEDLDEEDLLLPLAETLEVDGETNVLFTLVESEGLESILNDPGARYTIFAPIDSAFAATTLPADANTTSILQYHVISDEVLASDVLELNGVDVETLNGQTIKVTVRDGEVYLNDTIKVLETDIPASNGVIHLIDGVLLPQ